MSWIRLTNMIRLTVLTSLLLLPALACRNAPMPGGASVAAAEGSGSAEGATALAVSTTAFAPGGAIPRSFTCDGEGVSPDLLWTAAAGSVQSFAVIADDPDAPRGTFTHWLAWNIPAQSKGLEKNMPNDETLANCARQGRNGFGRTGYAGPCPPAGTTHRYFFKVFALDAKLDLKAGADRDELESAMKGHVMAQGEVMGTYGR
jgi:Raf kinase inhibitor-like YbhB/YbcL family protein